MNDKLKQLIKKSVKISLDKKDKGLMRANLLTFIRKSSNLEAVVAPATGRGVVLWFFKPTSALAGMLIVVILGSGISFAAENSLPGELLYPVKLNFNEEVRSLTLFSEEEKTEWETRRAERRIEEGEKLFVKGNLNEEKRKEIEEAFTRHADRAERGLEKIGEKSSIREEVSIKAVDESEFGPEKIRVTKIRERLKTRKIKIQNKKEEAIDSQL